MIVYTVSEINSLIKNVITNEFKNRHITVRGEISGIQISGRHTYLTLKDNDTAISVNFWNMCLKNEHGENVEISGKIDYYTKMGKISLIGNAIKNIGIGNLHNIYEKIKLEYEGKGYFNNSKTLPKIIKNVGVITSKTGAAIDDFIYILKKNHFFGNIYIYDCKVQGDDCPQSVSNAINYFNGINNIDALVITRGGGSFEDLIGFSNKLVLDAIYKSNKYTISAIGHERDHMLSDYIANYRAPTPSIAGEVISKIHEQKCNRINAIEYNILTIKNDIFKKIYEYKNLLNRKKQKIMDPYQNTIYKINIIMKQLRSHIKSTFNIYKQKIAKIDTQLKTQLNPKNDYEKLLNQKILRLNNITNKLKIIIRNDINIYNSNLNNCKVILNKNNIKDILKTGFALITNINNELIDDINNIFNKDVILIHSTGKIKVKIINIDDN